MNTYWASAMYQAQLRVLHMGYLIISSPFKTGTVFHFIDDEIWNADRWSLDLSPILSPSKGQVSSPSVSLSQGCSLGKKHWWLPPRRQAKQGGAVGWERGQCRQVGPWSPESVWKGARKVGRVDKPHPDACSEPTGPFLQKVASKPGLVVNYRCSHPTVHRDWCQGIGYACVLYRYLLSQPAWQMSEHWWAREGILLTCSLT